MGLVARLVVLNHLPHDLKLRFMPNGHVADVKCLVIKGASLLIFIINHFLHILGLSFSIYYHVTISKCHSLT